MTEIFTAKARSTKTERREGTRRFLMAFASFRVVFLRAFAVEIPEIR
jgi:hypothetical protein